MISDVAPDLSAIRWGGDNPLSAAEIHRPSSGTNGDEHEVDVGVR
jgi:hypothetical protein